MISAVVESAPVLIEVLLFGVGSTVLSLAGLYVEWFGVETLQSGQTGLGAWAMLAGLVLLGFGYLLGSDRLLPALRRAGVEWADATE